MDTTYSFQDGITSRTPLSGVCDWCETAARPGSGVDRLKKCGGCSVVLYCSKACQVQAWPTHKHMCRSRSKEQAAELGYPSAVSAASALKRWANIHLWPLRTIAEATAHQTGGGNPDANGSDNPSMAFRLEECGIVGKDDRDFLRSQWLLIESTCKSMAEAMREKLNEVERRTFAGFIPAAFYFKTSGMVSFHQYPLYRLREHGCGPSYGRGHTEEEHVLFDDISTCCMESINCGLVLRAPVGDDNQPLPDVGVFTPSKKSWVWKCLDWKWDTVGVGAPSQYRSGLYPAEIYRRYHKLLAQRNFQ
ncbi:hypothetical protein LXA43DRAFT_904786 [Ganoderma leucocontextum]|nr:hypothetical protein LXA43DRAFT_904786 [Ganoderma leucocontextum]